MRGGDDLADEDERCASVRVDTWARCGTKSVRRLRRKDHHDGSGRSADHARFSTPLAHPESVASHGAADLGAEPSNSFGSGTVYDAAMGRPMASEPGL
jgi:hypothetical protein